MVEKVPTILHVEDLCKHTHTTPIPDQDGYFIINIIGENQDTIPFTDARPDLTGSAGLMLHYATDAHKFIPWVHILSIEIVSNTPEWYQKFKDWYAAEHGVTMEEAQQQAISAAQAAADDEFRRFMNEFGGGF